MKQIENRIPYMDEKAKSWFIGFTEAEGSFTVANRGDLAFVITQGYRNIAVLYHIRELIGFGSITKQGPQTFRYVVQDEVGLGHIIEMLNGRLVLEKRISGLLRFITAYNKRYNKSIEGIEIRVMPTRNDGWFSGFIDGDGCFNIGYVTTKNRFQIRAIMSQKEDLTPIREITEGVVEYNKRSQSWSIVLKDVGGSLGKNTEWIIEYIEKYRLRTTKWNSYLLWKYIRNILLKDKLLTSNEIENLKKMVKLINQDPIQLQDIYIPLEDGEELL